MNHLTPHELAEAADPAPGSGAPHPHLAECETCRTALDELRALLADAQTAGEVPEPSPLFWDHFAARVRAATVDAEIPSRAPWWTAWTPALAVAAALVLTVIGWRLAGTVPTDGTPAGSAVVAERAAVNPVEAGPEDVPRVDAPEAAVPVDVLAEAVADADDDWLAASGLAMALSPESVASLAAPGPGAFLAEELTSRELQEFARLLRAEMGGVQ